MEIGLCFTFGSVFWLVCETVKGKRRVTVDRWVGVFCVRVCVCVYAMEHCACKFVSVCFYFSMKVLNTLSMFLTVA